jgi:hypothetical protein
LAGCGGGSSPSAPPPAQSSAAGDASPPLPTDASFVIAGGAASTIAAGTSASVGVPAWNIASGDKLTYTWTLTVKPAGSNAVLASASAAQASLTPDLPGSYVASMVASDGKRLSVPATTTVNVLDASAFKAFVELVNAGNCNDIASDLLLVDGKYVFADVAGNCPDASYSVGLYGLTPTPLLCGVSDSAAGPQRSCTDASVSSLFDTMFASRNASNLGLYSGHTVSKFTKPAPVLAGTTAISLTVIDQGISLHPSATDLTNAIARNSTDWAALWSDHKGAGVILPPVDFSKQAVLALYYPQLTSCEATAISRAYTANGQLTVEYTVKWTAAADAVCSHIAYSAAEIAVIDVAVAPGMPVVFKKVN